MEKKSKTNSNIDAVNINGKGVFLKKEYPVIYSYIYERESKDMKRILKEHESLKVENVKKPVQKISGFKIVNGKITPQLKDDKK